MEPVIVNQFVTGLRTAFAAGDPDVDKKVGEADNLACVQAVYHALACADIPAFMATLTDDVEFETVGPSVIPFTGHWRGRDEIVAAMARNFSFVTDQRVEVRTVVAQGDTVIVIGFERTVYRPTGRTYTLDWVHQFTLRGGKLQRFRQVFDSAALLAVLEPLPGDHPAAGS